MVREHHPLPFLLPPPPYCPLFLLCATVIDTTRFTLTFLNYTEDFDSQYYECTHYLLAKSAFLFIFVEHCYIVQVKLALQIETWKKQKKRQKHP